MSAMLHSLISSSRKAAEVPDSKDSSERSGSSGGEGGERGLSVKERKSQWNSRMPGSVSVSVPSLSKMGFTKKPKSASFGDEKDPTASASAPKMQSTAGKIFSGLTAKKKKKEDSFLQLSSSLSHLGRLEPLDEMTATHTPSSTQTTLRPRHNSAGSASRPNQRRLSSAVESRQKQLSLRMSTSSNNDLSPLAKKRVSSTVKTNPHFTEDSSSNHEGSPVPLAVVKRRMSTAVQSNPFIEREEDLSITERIDDPLPLEVVKKRMSAAVVGNAFFKGTVSNRRRFSGKLKRQDSLSRISVSKVATVRISIQEKIQLERKERQAKKDSTIASIPRKKNKDRHARRAGIFANGIKLNLQEPVQEPSPPTIATLLDPPTKTTQDFTSGRKDQRFEDAYEIGAKLGEGAFGTVYVCIHKETKAQRAVKVLHKDRMDSWEFDEVLAEFQMLTQMDNPNVIRAYEFYDAADKFYMVQELAQGGELLNQLEKHGKLKEQDVALLMKNILGCIQYLADKRIVHRDVNLENILLESSEQYSTVKLIDFGLAKTCQEGEKLYDFVGKARYLAPEVLGDDGYGLEYDVWSCGVIAAILLTGYYPFDSNNDMDVYRQIIDGAYINYDGSDWEGVSDQAKTFVQSLLTVDVLTRPTAKEALAHAWITNTTDKSVAPSGVVWVAPKTEQKIPEPETKLKVPTLVDQPTQSPQDFVSGREEKFEDIYELGKRLGEGAFGEVFSCTHKQLNVDRAVKIIQKAAMSEWEYDDVIKEFQMLTEIDNPNVIRVYEFYDTDDTFYIVQELAQGGELYDELQKNGKLAEKDVALVMKNVLACTDYLAQNHIIHRDINLENILLEEPGNYQTLKLIDFGLATKCSEGEKIFELVGKARYLAPEVLGDNGYGLGYDVWSTGVIAATLLTGYFPFDSDNDRDVYSQILDGARINYDGLDWEGISEQAKAFVRTLLTFEEVSRPTAAEALNHPWITGNTDNSPATANVWSAPILVQVQQPDPKAQLAAESSPQRKPKVQKDKQEKFEDVYEINAKLGEGALSEVFVCKHKTLRTERAVKIIQKAAMSEWEHDDVIKEFEMLTEVDNPNVIRVFEFYDTDETFYIVQELAKGGELSQVLQEHGKLAEKDVALVMEKVLTCIDYLAQNQIVHRDLNLKNLLLEEPGNYQTLKLIDFGLAKKCSEGEKLFELVGKTKYLAPEMLGDNGYGRGCDVWSSGVVAATLLTGYFPFDADNVRDVYSQLLDGAYINYNGIDWKGISDQAKAFVRMLLTYEEASRPTAAEALNHPWIMGNKQETKRDKKAPDVTIATIVQPPTGSAKDFVSGRQEKFEDVYEFKAKLGEGAFGEVFVCKHKYLGTERAVKVIQKAAMSEWQYDDVIKEFQMLTEIDNPNVIRVYEFYDTQETFYIVQELARGGELLDELQKHGKLAEKDVAVLMKSILGCTQYLADHRIAHRDINLENILLEESGEYQTVKLIDFGLATKCEEGQKLFEFVGKARYLAPEVLGDDGYGVACDVWSCGVIAAVLLTGYFPFDADSDKDVYSQIVNGAYINYNGPDWKGVSDQAKAFVKKLLRFQDDSRPTAQESLNHPWITGNTNDAPAIGEVWCGSKPKSLTQETAKVSRPCDAMRSNANAEGAKMTSKEIPSTVVIRSPLDEAGAARCIQRFFKEAKPHWSWYKEGASFWQENLEDIDRRRKEDLDDIQRLVEFEKQQVRLELELEYRGHTYPKSVRQMVNAHQQMAAVTRGEIRIEKQKCQAERKRIQPLRWENWRLLNFQLLNARSVQKVQAKIQTLNVARNNWMMSMSCLRRAMMEMRHHIAVANKRSKELATMNESVSSYSEAASSSSSSSASSCSSGSGTTSSGGTSLGMEMVDELEADLSGLSSGLSSGFSSKNKKKDRPKKRRSRKPKGASKPAMSESAREMDVSYSWKDHRNRMDASSTAHLQSDRRNQQDSKLATAGGPKKTPKKNRLSLAMDGSLRRTESVSKLDKSSDEEGPQRRNSIGSTDMDKELKGAKRKGPRKKRETDAVPALVELVKTGKKDDPPFQWQSHPSQVRGPIKKKKSVEKNPAGVQLASQK